ncbi:MAG TPA: class I SAM-dependent methyltransferase, partial [Nannocystis sp.]
MSSTEWSAARGEKWRAGLCAMEAMLLPTQEPLLRALQLDAPLRIADVGCGGGGTTLEISRRAPAGSVVDGLDISPALIELARARPRPDGRAVAFEVADLATATPRRPYDRLASRFGVMFFAEPDAAFANLARWLAPGGRLAFAVWGALSDNPWMSSVREVVAHFIDLPAIDPGAPGPFRYADPDELLAALARAGFASLKVDDWRGALPVGSSPAEAASFALSSFASFGELL